MESNLVSSPASSGELVVRNGRLRGTRRALAAMLTLIGRDPLCEFQVNVESVDPLHCAIVHGPTGFLLRDLGSESGTFLNGNAIQEAPLRHGDAIAVGPFEFLVHLPDLGEPLEALTAASLQSERDALRIQAAAVAAQQANLADEEGQLHQRRRAMQRQKEQLASHLDERRQHLLQLREQVRQGRAALKAETEAARRQNEEMREALVEERETLTKELQQGGKERRRLIELRKRLKKRWRKHWQAHESALSRREQQVQSERSERERQTEELKRERLQLTQMQLRFNSEIEVGRRHLQDEWQQLGLAQQQWEACLNQEQGERAVRLRDLERRVAVVAESERRLNEQRQAADQLRMQLRKETEGLDARIRNQRVKLLEQEKQLSRPQGDVEDAVWAMEKPPSTIHHPPSTKIDVPATLIQLADHLSDQRRHLLEQWQRLLEEVEAWEPERSAIIAQFETAMNDLRQQEQRLGVREQGLAAGEIDLRRRQQTLFDARCSLEAWQARLTARETFLDNERVMLLADVKSREELAEAQTQRLEELRQRRIRRRNQEIEEGRVARGQHEQMRRDYALLWQQCQQRRDELIREDRELSAKAMALEQFRRELLGRADDTPSADKRMESLCRRERARLQAEERDLQRQRTAVDDERKRLDQHAAQLRQQEETLAARHEEWMRQIAELEERQSALAELEQHRRQQVQHWQLVHEQDERQLAELREEVERIARLLLDENEVSVSTPLAA